jgi:cytochrome c oxidase cbb3-type subunit 3
MSDSHDHGTDPLQGKIVHEYDGILEADNQLPRWWLGIFFATIAFGYGYWFVFESWELASSPREAYDAERARAAESAEEVDDSTLEVLAADDTTLTSGRTAFQANCAACHGERAEGRIGPNLTDPNWLHGGAPTDIYRTVKTGVTARGMPAWGPVLGERQVRSVVAYVLTMRGTNVPGRAPEGEVWAPSQHAALEPAP